VLRHVVARGTYPVERGVVDISIVQVESAKRPQRHQRIANRQHNLGERMPAVEFPPSCSGAPPTKATRLTLESHESPRAARKRLSRVLTGESSWIAIQPWRPRRFHSELTSAQTSIMSDAGSQSQTASWRNDGGHAQSKCVRVHPINASRKRSRRDASPLSRTWAAKLRRCGRVADVRALYTSVVTAAQGSAGACAIEGRVWIPLVRLFFGEIHRFDLRGPPDTNRCFVRETPEADALALPSRGCPAELVCTYSSSWHRLIADVSHANSSCGSSIVRGSVLSHVE